MRFSCDELCESPSRHLRDVCPPVARFGWANAAVQILSFQIVVGALISRSRNTPFRIQQSVVKTVQYIRTRAATCHEQKETFDDDLMIICPFCPTYCNSLNFCNVQFWRLLVLEGKGPMHGTLSSIKPHLSNKLEDIYIMFIYNIYIFKCVYLCIYESSWLEMVAKLMMWLCSTYPAKAPRQYLPAVGFRNSIHCDHRFPMSIMAKWQVFDQHSKMMRCFSVLGFSLSAQELQTHPSLPLAYCLISLVLKPCSLPYHSLIGSIKSSYCTS